ncbi:MAG: aminotransferase class IV [Flavobacteriaceae bacterium]
MYNCNGTLVSDLSQTSPELLSSLFESFSIREDVRLHGGQILFWEKHYFRLIASLRRHRFFIPMNYTMEFFEQEIQKLGHGISIFDNAIIHLQFLKQNSSTVFIMKIQEVEALQIHHSSDYTIDLYKEAEITSGNLSNLSVTNWGLRVMAKQYANENGLDDVILLNEQKNIVETLMGSLFLIQEDTLLTPKLETGCQDLVFRSVFIDWIKKNRKDLQLVEKELNPFELQKSEELLILSLEKGISGVKQYRKTNYQLEKISTLATSFFNNLV